MSTFRKTVLTTAIIGAGLASTSGAAFATEGGHDGGHHESHKASAACANLTKAVNNNGGKALLDVVGGSQALSSTNVCNNLNGNSIASGNNLAGGNIQNGSNTVKSNSTTTASTTGKNSPATILTGILGG